MHDKLCSTSKAAPVFGIRHQVHSRPRLLRRVDTRIIADRIALVDRVPTGGCCTFRARPNKATQRGAIAPLATEVAATEFQISAALVKSILSSAQSDGSRNQMRHATGSSRGGTEAPVMSSVPIYRRFRHIEMQPPWSVANDPASR